MQDEIKPEEVTIPVSASPPVLNTPQQVADAVTEVQVPASSNTPRHKLGKWGVVLIIVAIVGVLTAGSAAAYFAVILPNQPENILMQAIQNTADEQKIAFEGSVATAGASTGTIPPLEIGINGQADRETSAVSASIDVSVAAVTIPIEVVKIGQENYVKLGDTSGIESLAKLALPQYVDGIERTADILSDQWIRIDQETANTDDIACAVDTQLVFTKEDLDILQSQFGKHPFATIDNVSGDVVNGADSLKYDMTIDTAKLDDFANGLNELSFIKALENCGGQKEQLPAASTGSAPTYVPMTIWVNKADKVINKVAATVLTTGKEEVKITAEMTMAYGEATISKPQDAKSADEVIGELQQVLQENIDAVLPLLNQAESQNSAIFDFL